MRRALALALLALLLSGCGFQLRGLHGGEAVAFAADPAASPEALSALRRAGLVFRSDAPRILLVRAPRWQRQTVSVDSAGRPLGHRLSLILDYRIRSPDGRTLAAGRLQLFRDYISAPEEALSQEAQETPLREALWREAAERLRQEATP